MTGFEPAASCSQSRRATNCATPGYSVLSYYTTLGAKIKDFPVCGQSCGQSRFSARLADPSKSRKRPCCKGFRASVAAVVDSPDGTPKPPALPAAPHPDIHIRFFVFCVEVGQTVVKGKIYAVLRFVEVRKTRINKGVSGFLFLRCFGFTTLPKQARYQLRYTPILYVYRYRTDADTALVLYLLSMALSRHKPTQFKCSVYSRQ